MQTIDYFRYRFHSQCNEKILEVLTTISSAVNFSGTRDNDLMDDSIEDNAVLLYPNIFSFQFAFKGD